MKQRVISALVALCVLAMVLFCYNTVVFNAAIAIISVVAVFELLCATKYVTNRGMVAASLVYAAVVPFFGTSSDGTVSDLCNARLFCDPLCDSSNTTYKSHV